ncbi:MAG: SPOR domain-containing protein [Deferribacteraceae bacterium]|jgi:cell division septation protein DedD|nr:SPOR domain-containing protein [Deferribacteraceae bacterium]
MDNEGKPTKKGEFLMIAVVVALTFGLTVTGVVYLAKYLIGAPPANRAVVSPKQDEEVVIRYSIEPDNNSAVIITDSDIPQNGDNKSSSYSGSGFRPIAIVPATPQPPADAAPTPPTPPTITPAPLIAAAPQTTAAPVASAQPAPVKSSIGKYQLQLFAFSNKSTADAEAAKLRGEYPDIYVVQAEVRGGIWYRVRCCRTDSRNEAERVRGEITAKYKDIRPDIISN